MTHKGKVEDYFKPFQGDPMGQQDGFGLYEALRNTSADGMSANANRNLEPGTLVQCDGFFGAISREVTIGHIKRQRGEMCGRGPDGRPVSFPCGGYGRDVEKADF